MGLMHYFLFFGHLLGKVKKVRACLVPRRHPDSPFGEFGEDWLRFISFTAFCLSLYPDYCRRLGLIMRHVGFCESGMEPDTP